MCCLSVADFLQRLLQRKRLLNWSPCVCVCVLRVLVCSDVVIIIVVFPQSVAAVLVCSLSISFTRHIEFYYRKLYYIICTPLAFFHVFFGSCVFLISGIFTVITHRLYFPYANFYDYSQVMMFVHKVSSYFGSHAKICEILEKLLRRTWKTRLCSALERCFYKRAFSGNSS